MRSMEKPCEWEVTFHTPTIHECILELQEDGQKERVTPHRHNRSWNRTEFGLDGFIPGIVTTGCMGKVPGFVGKFVGIVTAK